MIMQFLIALILALPAFASENDRAFILEYTPAVAFEQAAARADRLLKECPPERYIYLSVGITNTLLDSFLRNRLREMNQPLDTLRYVPYQGVNNIYSYPAEDADSFFENTLPKSSELVGKKLLLLRYLDHGMSLKFFGQALQNYRTRNGLEWELEGDFVYIQKANFKPHYNDGLRRELNFPMKIGLMVNNSGIQQSYRPIDGKYYRYAPKDLHPYPAIYDFHHETENTLRRELPRRETSDPLNQAYFNQIYMKKVKAGKQRFDPDYAFYLFTNAILSGEEKFGGEFGDQMRALSRAKFEEKMHKLRESLGDGAQDNPKYQILDKITREFLKYRRATCQGLL